jgi:hypothetical protein
MKRYADIFIQIVKCAGRCRNKIISPRDRHQWESEELYINLFAPKQLS